MNIRRKGETASLALISDAVAKRALEACNDRLDDIERALETIDRKTNPAQDSRFDVEVMAAPSQSNGVTTLRKKYLLFDGEKYSGETMPVDIGKIETTAAAASGGGGTINITNMYFDASGDVA